MQVGKYKVSDLCLFLCASVFFFGATESQVRVVVCVKLWGIKKIKKGSGTQSFRPKPTYSTVQSFLYLEYVSLEDVVSQFHSLLPI